MAYTITSQFELHTQNQHTRFLEVIFSKTKTKSNIPKGGPKLELSLGGWFVSPEQLVGC